ncbi:Crp/Fnr family transcriptional regulator [Candidatus Latescibacterota bacterium]
MDEMQLTREMLRVPLFEDLGIDQATTLVRAGTCREVPVGTVLREPDTVDESLLILVEGALRLETADGTELAEITPPRVLGEMGVLTLRPRSSRVLCTQPASVLEVSREAIGDLVETDPELLHALLISLVKLLYDRTHEMNNDIGALRHRVNELGERLREVAPDDPLLEVDG